MAKNRTYAKRPMRDRGIALVTALIITFVVFMLIMSTLYVITGSITMSGAGKRYATAAEAADGAVEATKEAINLVWWTDPPPAMFPTGNCDGKTYDLPYAIMNKHNPCTTTITLPSSLGGRFTATISLEYLYVMDLPGSRLEFARAGGAPATKAMFYRITTKVTDTSNNTTAENAALYRFTG